MDVDALAFELKRSGMVPDGYEPVYFRRGTERLERYESDLQIRWLDICSNDVLVFEREDAIGCGEPTMHGCRRH